jgi:hypothetical protein
MFQGLAAPIAAFKARNADTRWQHHFESFFFAFAHRAAAALRAISLRCDWVNEVILAFPLAWPAF